MLWLFLRLFVLLAVGLVIVAWLSRGYRGRRRTAREIEAATKSLHTQLPELGERFREAANQTGKPRGLAWKRCELAEATTLLAADRTTGTLFALIGVTISFEATPGGGMEEVEAVSNLRSATAVFEWREGRWQTEGRAVFNLEPHEAIERYAASLQPIGL